MRSRGAGTGEVRGAVAPSLFTSRKGEQQGGGAERREGGAGSLGDDTVGEQGSGRRCGAGLGLRGAGPQFGHRWSDHFQEASAAPDGKRYPSCRLTPINKLGTTLKSLLKPKSH